MMKLVNFRILLLSASLFFISCIAFMHYWGLAHTLYWRFWWYDILAHLSGGAWLVSTILYFFFKKIGFILVILTILGVGIAWEIFELVIGEASFQGPNYINDTISDLVADVVGGTIMYWTYFKLAYRDIPL